MLEKFLDLLENLVPRYILVSFFYNSVLFAIFFCISLVYVPVNAAFAIALTINVILTSIKEAFETFIKRNSLESKHPLITITASTFPGILFMAIEVGIKLKEHM